MIIFDTILCNPSYIFYFYEYFFYYQAAAAEDERARTAQNEAEAAELVAMQERLQGL